MAEMRNYLKDRHPEESHDSETYPLRFAYLRQQGSLARVNEMLDMAREQAAPGRLIGLLDHLRVHVEQALKAAPRPWSANGTPPREEPGEYKVLWGGKPPMAKMVRMEDLLDEDPVVSDEKVKADGDKAVE